MAEVANYRTFTDPEEAEVIVSIIGKAGIPYRIDRARAPVDLTFSSDMAHERIILCIPADLFVEADKALASSVAEEPESSFGEHYLNDFSSEELIELLHKAHEWSPGDVVIARRLLAKRGVDADEESITAKQQENLAAIREPVPGDKFMIAAGFLLALLGGLLGIALGWSYATLKERDATGKEFYRYDTRTRELGRLMMYLGIVCGIAWVLARCVLRPA